MPGPQVEWGQSVNEAEGEPVECSRRQLLRALSQGGRTHQLFPTTAWPSTTIHSAVHTLPTQPPTLLRVVATHRLSRKTATGWSRKKTKVPLRSRNESVVEGGG